MRSVVRVHLSPLKKLNKSIWGYSSVGRAPALQAGGHEFESRYLHSDGKTSVMYLENCIQEIYDKKNIKTSEVIVITKVNND